MALQSLGVITKQKCDGKRKSSVYRFINQFLVKSLVGMSSEAAGPACSAQSENLLFWACWKTAYVYMYICLYFVISCQYVQYIHIYIYIYIYICHISYTWVRPINSYWMVLGSILEYTKNISKHIQDIQRHTKICKIPSRRGRGGRPARPGPGAVWWAADGGERCL